MIEAFVSHTTRNIYFGIRLRIRYLCISKRDTDRTFRRFSVSVCVSGFVPGIALPLFLQRLSGQGGDVDLVAVQQLDFMLVVGLPRHRVARVDADPP